VRGNVEVVMACFWREMGMGMELEAGAHVRMRECKVITMLIERWVRNGILDDHI
jgi:hypothetical protein